jgi:hypothetical protein
MKMELMRIIDAFEIEGTLVVTGRLSEPDIKTLVQARQLFGKSVRLVGARGDVAEVEIKDVAFSWGRDGAIQASVAIEFPAKWRVNSRAEFTEILINGYLEQ